MLNISDEELKPLKKTKSYEKYEFTHQNQDYIFMKIYCNDPEDALFTMKEFENYKNITQCHNAFAPILEVFQTNLDNTCFIHSKFKNDLQGLLAELSKNQTKFTAQELIDHYYHLAEGLKLIHENGLLNSYINSKSIFYDGNKLKFTTFKLNNSLMKDISKWNAFLPININTDNYDTSTEVFCLGGIFFEMLTFKHFNPKQDYSNFQFDTNNYPKNLIELIIKMVDLQDNKRPSIKDVCNILKTFKPHKEKVLLFQDIVLNISRFLQPQEFVKKVMKLCKHYYSIGSKDEIWKFYFKMYSYLFHQWTPKDYGFKTYKELFNTKTLHLKTKSKNISISKDLKRCVMNNKKEPNEFAYSIESIKPNERATIRIKYIESIYGCFVGIVPENNLKTVLETNDPTKMIKFIRYMRDGSIGGMRLKNNEKIERARMIDGKLYRVFFKTFKNDYLTIHIDRIDNKIYFIVNDHVNSLLELSNLEDLKSTSPIYIVFSGLKNQGFEISNHLMKMNEIFQPKKSLEFSKSI